jgi:hypothetical protein
MAMFKSFLDALSTRERKDEGARDVIISTAKPFAPSRFSGFKTAFRAISSAVSTTFSARRPALPALLARVFRHLRPDKTG